MSADNNADLAAHSRLALHKQFASKQMKESRQQRRCPTFSDTCVTNLLVKNVA